MVWCCSDNPVAEVENIKSLLNHVADMAALISKLTFHCKIMDTGHRAADCMVCLSTFQLSQVLVAPTHGRMARLSSAEWRNGLPICR